MTPTTWVFGPGLLTFCRWLQFLHNICVQGGGGHILYHITASKPWKPKLTSHGRNNGNIENLQRWKVHSDLPAGNRERGCHLRLFSAARPLWEVTMQHPWTWRRRERQNTYSYRISSPGKVDFLLRLHLRLFWDSLLCDCGEHITTLPSLIHPLFGPRFWNRVLFVLFSVFFYLSFCLSLSTVLDSFRRFASSSRLCWRTSALTSQCSHPRLQPGLWP